MKRQFFGQLALLVATAATIPVCAEGGYWLVIGSYRQGPGGRPEVSGITSPTIYAIPMDNLEQCKTSGKQISEEIYTPVWQFDSRWTCVQGTSAR